METIGICRSRDRFGGLGRLMKVVAVRSHSRIFLRHEYLRSPKPETLNRKHHAMSEASLKPNLRYRLHRESAEEPQSRHAGLWASEVPRELFC